MSDNKKKEQLNDKQFTFLTYYFTEKLNERLAAKKAGIDTRTVRRWKHQRRFQEEREHVRDQWRDEILATTIEDAVKGDRVLKMFLLKALEPETFDERVRQQRIANEGLRAAVQQLPNITFITPREDVIEVPTKFADYVTDESKENGQTLRIENAD